MMDAEFAAARESIHRSIGQRARWAKTHIAREVSKHLPYDWADVTFPGGAFGGPVSVPVS